MGVDEGNLHVIDVDVIVENCPITMLTLNLLVYNSAIQYSNIAMIVVVLSIFHNGFMLNFEE